MGGWGITKLIEFLNSILTFVFLEIFCNLPWNKTQGMFDPSLRRLFIKRLLACRVSEPILKVG